MGTVIQHSTQLCLPRPSSPLSSSQLPSGAPRPPTWSPPTLTCPPPTPPPCPCCPPCPRRPPRSRCPPRPCAPRRPPCPCVPRCRCLQLHHRPHHRCPSCRGSCCGGSLKRVCCPCC